MVLDNSVVVAVIALCGSALVTVLGVVVARILGTNKEEMERLEGVERRYFVLEDYAHDLRDWGAGLRQHLIDAGLPAGEPMKPWPDELTRRHGDPPAARRS